jgi:hypothetical protein
MPIRGVAVVSAVLLALTACARGATEQQSNEPGSGQQDEISGDQGGDAESQATSIKVKVENGRIIGVGDSVRVSTGTRVRIRVGADVEDEVHVHGYDLMSDVAPGDPAVIAFKADIPGVFEVELESAGVQLFELEVQ